MKKKVLVLASTFPRWKNDTTPPFVFELERRLAKDFAITILAPHFPGAKKVEVREGLKIYRFQYFWPARLQKLCYEGGILPNLKKHKWLIFQGLTLIICEFITATKIIKREKIDLVHSHWIIPQGIVALLVKKLFGVPYLVTTHGGDLYGLKGGLLKAVKKMILNNATKITVVSNAIKTDILHTINSNLQIDVISMGVDGVLFNPDKYDASLKKKYGINGPFLLFVGRLAEKKGVRYLLYAMPEIIKKFPNVKLLIIGEGMLENDLRFMITDLGLKNNVELIGGVPNSELPKYYATADIFISPSLEEGLGMTFVEASFSGCIPIGTNVGGISDVIKNNETGFLVREKDPHVIAEKVIQLLKNNQLIKDMKHKARKANLEKFDWNIVANNYRSVYLTSYYEGSV